VGAPSSSYISAWDHPFFFLWESPPVWLDAPSIVTCHAPPGGIFLGFGGLCRACLLQGWVYIHTVCLSLYLHDLGHTGSIMHAGAAQKILHFLVCTLPICYTIFFCPPTPALPCTMDFVSPFHALHLPSSLHNAFHLPLAYCTPMPALCAVEYIISSHLAHCTLMPALLSCTTWLTAHLHLPPLPCGIHFTLPLPRSSPPSSAGMECFFPFAGFTAPPPSFVA
jgi:hypothetical protein